MRIGPGPWGFSGVGCSRRTLNAASQAGAAGGGGGPGDQGVVAGGDTAPTFQLHGGRGRERRAKPLGDQRMKGQLGHGAALAAIGLALMAIAMKRFSLKLGERDV